MASRVEIYGKRRASPKPTVRFSNQAFKTPPSKSSSASTRTELHHLTPELFLNQLHDNERSPPPEDARQDIMKVRELKSWLAEFEESNRKHYQRGRQSMPVYRSTAAGGLLATDGDDDKSSVKSGSKSGTNYGPIKPTSSLDFHHGIVTAVSTESSMTVSDCDKSCGSTSYHSDHESSSSARSAKGSVERRVTCKKITPDDLPFLRPKPQVPPKSRRSLGRVPSETSTLVGQKVKKWGGNGGPRQSLIESRKVELEKQWAESKKVEHVTKVKWGYVDGVYKRTVVVDVKQK